MSNPSIEILHELFDWETIPGKLIRKTTVASNAIKGSFAGTLCKTTKHIMTSIQNKKYNNSRLIFVCKYEYWPEHDVDHIDRNPLNDHPDNLEEKTRQCNTINTGNFAHNKSGVKGVHWDTQRRRWFASIKVNRCTRYLGRYSTIDNAICARYAAEQCLEWNKCNLNSPAYQYIKLKINSNAL